MVKEWLEQGNNAAALDLSCENLSGLKEESKGRLLCIKCDVRSADDMKRAAQSAKEEFGSIDYAVHNACICLFKNFEEHTVEDFDAVLCVNLLGAVNLTKAVLPIMKRQKSGRVCLTSSGAGITGFANISSYAASKGAIEAFAKCMNIEHRNSGVTFHLLHPPLTSTKSSAPLPVPKEFMASPENVGKGLVRRLDKKKFIIAHSAGGSFSLKMSYLFPIAMGNMLAKMTERSAKRD